MGTPDYICSTYVRTLMCDAKEEIYSFGVIIAEVLSGKMQGTGNKFFEDNFDAIVADVRPVQGCEDIVISRLLDVIKV